MRRHLAHPEVYNLAVYFAAVTFRHLHHDIFLGQIDYTMRWSRVSSDYCGGDLHKS